MERNGGRVGMLVERGSRHRRRREAVTRPVSIDCEKAPFDECAKRLLSEGSQEGGEEGRTRARAHTHRAAMFSSYRALQTRLPL